MYTALSAYERDISKLSCLKWGHPILSAVYRLPPPSGNFVREESITRHVYNSNRAMINYQLISLSVRKKTVLYRLLQHENYGNTDENIIILLERLPTVSGTVVEDHSCMID